MTMRIILYLGKGGVGKTTVAAATAVRSALLGKRTLVVSTDLAHSLADCLNTQLASDPRPLSTNLWAQEVNVLDEMRRGWSKVQDAMSKVLRKQGMDGIMAEELALIPGMDEIVGLTNIYRNARDHNFEVVIIDAAPTGETVRLLSMPDTFQWYAKRITGSSALNLARPLIKAFVPSIEILDAVQTMSERVKTLGAVLSNPEISSYRPVVIQEVPYYSPEIICIPQLTDLAQTIFGDQDPTQIFYRGQVQEVTRVGDTYVLRLPLPHVEMDKVLMTKKGDEMIVEIGTFKRDITLPSMLANQEAKLARFVNKALEIHFTAPEEERQEKSA